MSENKTRGIILAGGAGSRLYPLTDTYSKQLQAVYDKPMIYYPLATLMLVGIQDILIISTPQDTPEFKELLGDGSQWGISLSYCVQEEPNGIAEAFIIGDSFVGDDDVCLILGDNLFYGNLEFLRNGLNNNSGATIFGYQVNDPSRYAVVEFDEERKVTSLQEKPENPASNYAVPGIYVYDNQVVDIAKNIEPSDRGELEITAVNKAYMHEDELLFEPIGRGVAWLDTGTPKSLAAASEFIKTIEVRQGLKIGCVEEIALTMEYIDARDFENLLEEMPECPYREYLEKVFARHARTSTHEIRSEYLPGSN